MPGTSSVAKGIFASVIFASGLWLALGLAASQTPPSSENTAAPAQNVEPPPPGVIGGEDRVRLEEYAPADPRIFPGWEQVQNAVMRVSCDGGATGGGVLIGDGTRMITAAHVFVNLDGTVNDWRSDCLAHHPGGDAVGISLAGMKSGGFTVPDALGTHFSVAITARDWAIVRLSRMPRGAQPLPLAGADQLELERGTQVLNISGAHDTFEVPGFLAQTCTYFGVPPTASHLVDGQIVGRLAEPGDELRVARYDCDLGLGGSGSPIIGWFDGAPYVWGILTDSLRGAPICPRVERTSCYSAGPLVTTMDVIE